MTTDGLPLSYRFDGGTFKIEGVLDEQGAPVLAAILQETASHKAVVLDVGAVKRINSLGVRGWCDFMKKLHGRAVTFRRCSPAFVEQLNSISDFRADAQIESLIAPYVCETTGTVFYEELTVGKDVQKKNPVPPSARPCEKCPKPLVFDDLPERYLHFLTLL